MLSALGGNGEEGVEWLCCAQGRGRGVVCARCARWNGLTRSRQGRRCGAGQAERRRPMDASSTREARRLPRRLGEVERRSKSGVGTELMVVSIGGGGSGTDRTRAEEIKPASNR